MDQSKNLPNFQKVNDNLYRGGQPKKGGFAQLKKLGIKTVIYLRSDEDKALNEKKLAEAAGINFLHFPLGNWDRPDQRNVDKILAHINDAENQPVFVHCRRGSDRTGTVIAIYRMTHEGWDAKKASDEAKKFGIGWWQRGMREFINDYYRNHIRNDRNVIDNYHRDAVQSFGNYKRMAERAIEQVNDEEFFALIDPEANSIALIVKHIAGNLRSRWTDFLTSDGEKPDRNRDTEFELIGDGRESLMQFWEAGWQTLFDNVGPLTTDDFSRTITIRGEPHTICEAINRQMTHYAYHVGQIVLLAKHFRSSGWKTLSVAKNRSAEFNQFLAEKQSKGIMKTDRVDASQEFRDGGK
jgi:uncharacterized protein (TIGR01244 family)